jgi:glucosamine--fructose-6-phosphate aminotransferase (isomerizing)
LFDGQDDLLIAARKGSPLAIGHGDGEMFVGSDAIALAPMTDQVTYLEEGDRAILTRTSVEIFDESGAQVQRTRREIKIDATRIEKAGHKHYMSKEIFEQPTVISEALNYYMSADGASLILPEPGIDFTKYDRIVMVACGTAYYACFTAKYWFEQIAKVPVEVDIASEFRYREAPISPRTLAIYVSQSGETADTLAALRYTAGKAETIITVTNSSESSMARESDMSLPILAGVEVGVASTKAFSCQLTVLLMLALKAAQDRGVLSDDAIKTQLSALRSLPGLLNLALDQSNAISDISALLAESSDVLFLGRGAMYPLALEGALKLKEISYIHAEGYASGELKHGPIALVDQHTPIIVLAPRDKLFEKTVSNMQEVMARGGKVLLISDEQGLKEAGDGVWQTIQMPTVPDALAPILYAVPAQLLAYHTAVAKGTDVDQPRNLAKSVTVE